MNAGPAPSDPGRASLLAGRAVLHESYVRDPSPRRLLRAHARLIDGLLRALWKSLGPVPGAALVATGGYGRGELFPHSDIDVLVLLGREPSERERAQLERLVGSFWDIGLEVGHSVRTVAECTEAAAGDITIQTALLEARYLAGRRALYRELASSVTAALDARSFFKGKRLEQEQRHAKHQDTAYALEPNLKEAPGGLRDLQTIQWMARACGLGNRWRDLVRDGLLLPAEAVQIARREAVLHDLRIRLHYLAGRREDRIVFDYQTSLAEQCGFHGSPARRASEQLMQRYYTTAKTITQLNTIVLQNLEARLDGEPDAEPEPLNERFQVRAERLEACDENLFERNPRAILESFVLLQQHQALRGMSAATLRALWRARTRVNARLRRDPAARLLFLHFLQQPRGIVHEFRRMNQYGILGRYLPEFGRIVGQMQHDLFH
ncbi:MAG: nucleotidyltransferase domain-containing protein, partial [Burkholderiales bacterium]